MLNTDYSVRHPQFLGKGGSLVRPSDAITAKRVDPPRLSVDKADLDFYGLLDRQVGAMQTGKAVVADVNSMKVFDWGKPWTFFNKLSIRKKARQVATAFETMQDDCEREFGDREQAAMRDVARSSLGKHAGHGKRTTRSSK